MCMRMPERSRHPMQLLLMVGSERFFRRGEATGKPHPGDLRKTGPGGPDAGLRREETRCHLLRDLHYSDSAAPSTGNDRAESLSCGVMRYRMISPAIERTSSGTVIPSSLAFFRLILRWNSAVSIGTSPAGVPRNILPASLLA